MSVLKANEDVYKPKENSIENVNYLKSKIKSPIKKKNDKVKSTNSSYINTTNNIKNQPNLTSSKKRKLTWKSNYVETVNVISYKRYNLENTHDDPNINKSNNVKCRCIIF